MSDEMKKATRRRIMDRRYNHRWFIGHGLDIGCGGDPLKPSHFTNCKSITGYDQCLGNGDAQYLRDIEDNTYDFVVSSHCLEHMHEIYCSLDNWLRVLKPQGFLIVTIPEWRMYEHKHWPSKFNGDHKHSFTMQAASVKNLPGHVLYVPQLLMEFATRCDIEMMQLLTEHFDESLSDTVDQTGTSAECAIEFVLRKV